MIMTDNDIKAYWKKHTGKDMTEDELKDVHTLIEDVHKYVEEHYVEDKLKQL